jgi:hypothetical protein
MLEINYKEDRLSFNLRLYGDDGVQAYDQKYMLYAIQHECSLITVGFFLIYLTVF